VAWIYHPKLDRLAEVPDGAEVVWAHSGWKPAEPPPPPPPPPAEEQTAAAPRRRSSKSQPATAGDTSEE
jgi:hypothetical protein